MLVPTSSSRLMCVTYRLTLTAKRKPGGVSLHPALHDRRLAASGRTSMFDLDRVEGSRVVLEPVARGAAGRVEDAVPPVAVVPARAADPYRVSASASRLHSCSLPAATTRERPIRSSGAAPNGGVVGQVDRETLLAHEQLRRCDVDRARRLQRDDAVDAAGGEVAERDRERAHHAQPVRDAVEPRRVLATT